ncbi:sigma factor [Oceanomicrobium pacificus]|uniref:RNA polymerase sigma-70 region 2 domain-containing protein n=1 Tax=Oceanomicrobium pacificus TaxID=2692916 RepID=A0A6B0TQP2_9RHOB|nr:sigma factor [Oceanomicrobium pacificus]MXU65009.1 hypothetical protein [Oceanomicrobium pacificus]
MQVELEPKHVHIITSEAAAMARHLQRKLGLPVCEQEDLAQDLLVDLLRRLPAYDPAKGSLGAFSGLILRNQASRIAMKIVRERRAAGGFTVSLDAPVAEDDPRPLVEAISDTQGLAAWHGQHLSQAEKQQGRISLETALAQLPPPNITGTASVSVAGSYLHAHRPPANYLVKAAFGLSDPSRAPNAASKDI